MCACVCVCVFGAKWGRKVEKRFKGTEGALGFSVTAIASTDPLPVAADRIAID